MKHCYHVCKTQPEAETRYDTVPGILTRNHEPANSQPLTPRAVGPLSLPIVGLNTALVFIRASATFLPIQSSIAVDYVGRMGDGRCAVVD